MECNDSEGALDLPEDFDLDAELRTFDLVAFTDHQALAERLNELLPDGPDGEAKVTWSTEVVGTPALKAATGMLDEGFQALAVAWAQHGSRAAGGQEIDGVWWPDLLDVYAYSAPRGLIFRERMPAWHARQIP